MPNVSGSTTLGELAVIIGMRENVSSQMPKVTSQFQSSKQAMRELASGTAYMGTAFLGLSVALEKTNNNTAKNVSNLLAIAGGIATAVGSASGFVVAGEKITDMLKKQNFQLMIQKALSGPMGWAMLAGSVAVAAGAYYGMSRAGGGGGESKPQTVNVRTTVVLDRKVVGESVRTETIKAQKRNGNSSGIRN